MVIKDYLLNHQCQYRTFIFKSAVKWTSLKSFLYVVQIEEIRTSIDKIDENVGEIKRLYSVILSAPTSDQS